MNGGEEVLARASLCNRPLPSGRNAGLSQPPVKALVSNWRSSRAPQSHPVWKLTSWDRSQLIKVLTIHRTSPPPSQSSRGLRKYLIDPASRHAITVKPSWTLTHQQLPGHLVPVNCLSKDKTQIFLHFLSGAVDAVERLFQAWLGREMEDEVGRVLGVCRPWRFLPSLRTSIR